MRHSTFFKSLLLLCALMAVGGNICWAQSLTVDFESEAKDYSDWTFTNFLTQQTNSNVTAHGGSYFGSTGGKASGSLVTNEKVASPQSITFYVSKTSTNSTASSWIVKVSEDGSNWTVVGDEQSASSGITRGTWTEVTRDLSSYSNVYVGVFYAGTTAVRTIDDVTLTYGVAGVDIKVEDVTMYVGQQKMATELCQLPSDFDGKVSLLSSDIGVAKTDIDGEGNGYLVALYPGTATITVTASDNDKPATVVNFTLTVKSMDVEPEGKDAGSAFAKVTKTADITDGQYLIVYEGDATHSAVAFNGGLGGDKKLDQVGNGIAVTISDGEITATDALKAATFTIDLTNCTLRSGSDYYIGVSSNSNGLNETVDGSEYTNSFAIDDNGNAVINAVFDGSTMSLRYNTASNQSRFRYYKNASQQPIALYKLVKVNTFDITMGTAGYRTIVSAKDATLPEDLTAYVVTDNLGGKATLAEVTDIKAGEAYVLQGAAGTYKLTMVDNATAPEGNMLKVSDGSQNSGVWVLANRDGKVGFYMWNGGSLGKGRVYLPKPSDISVDDVEAPAYDFLSLSIDSSTTGIGTTLTDKAGMDKACYNLQGQRVAQPTKGLYIVNGKKYVIK